jgi:hypothetical protein
MWANIRMIVLCANGAVIHERFGGRRKQTGSQLIFLPFDYAISFFPFLWMLFTKNVSLWRILKKDQFGKNWFFSKEDQTYYFLLLRFYWRLMVSWNKKNLKWKGYLKQWVMFLHKINIFVYILNPSDQRIKVFLDWT